jgi:RNA polymerase sigma factor (sigma-70 family)
LAEDLAQDALEAGLRGPAKEVHDPRKWLAGALRNLHSKELRKRKVRRERQADFEGETGDSEQQLERLQIQRKVADAISLLQEEHRNVLVLRYFEERTIRAIGVELGIGRTAVSHRISQAQRALRTVMREQLGSQWAMMFLPLALPRSPFFISAVTIGGASASVGAALAVTLLLGAAAAWLIWSPGDELPADREAAVLVADGSDLRGLPGSGGPAEVRQEARG